MDSAEAEKDIPLPSPVDSGIAGDESMDSDPLAEAEAGEEMGDRRRQPRRSNTAKPEAIEEPELLEAEVIEEPDIRRGGSRRRTGVGGVGTAGRTGIAGRSRNRPLPKRRRRSNRQPQAKPAASPAAKKKPSSPKPPVEETEFVVGDEPPTEAEDDFGTGNFRQLPRRPEIERRLSGAAGRRSR